MDIDLEALDENTYRLIKYEFSEDVLRLPSIQVISPRSTLRHTNGFYVWLTANIFVFYVWHLRSKVI